MRCAGHCSTSPRCAVQASLHARPSQSRHRGVTCCVLAVDAAATTKPESAPPSLGSGSALCTPDGVPREKMPKHVAIIMDGNRRWAQQQGIRVALGHQAGVTALRRAVRSAVQWGIPALTVFAFSTENWSRSRGEVDLLLLLFEGALRQHLQELHQQKAVVRFIGDLNRLPASLRAAIAEAQALTWDNGGLQLTIAMSYSGRQDVVGAVQQIAAAVAAGQLQPHQVTEDLLASHLSTAQLTQAIGPPDLLIRTSGEQRLSNYLLWDLAYTELAFPPVLWPDFGEEEFGEALRQYAGRQRRFGVA